MGVVAVGVEPDVVDFNRSSVSLIRASSSSNSRLRELRAFFFSSTD